MDKDHINALLACQCYTAVYQLAYKKAHGYKAERLNLEQQRQLTEYIDILRICIKFKGNLIATHMNIKDYVRNTSRQIS